MNRNNDKLRTVVAIAATLLFPAATLAQVDTSEWKCEYCPFDDGYRAEVDAGVGYVSDDAARFGNGTGQDAKEAYVDLGGAGRYLKDGTEVSWYAESLGDRLSRAEYLQAADPESSSLASTTESFPTGCSIAPAPYSLHPVRGHYRSPQPGSPLEQPTALQLWMHRWLQ